MSKLIEIHESVWDYMIDTDYPKYDNRFKTRFIQEINNSNLGGDFKLVFQDYFEDYISERDTVIKLISQAKYIGQSYNYRNKWETLFNHLSNYIMTEAIVTILPALYYTGVVSTDKNSESELFRNVYHTVYTDAPNTTYNDSLTNKLRKALLSQTYIPEFYTACLKLYGIPIHISVTITPVCSFVSDDNKEANLDIIDISTKISFIAQGDYIEHTLKHYIVEE